MIVRAALVTILLAGLFAFGRTWVADTDPNSSQAKGKAELQRAVSSLQPRASFDTRPFEFTMAGVRYRIPRNYLFRIENPDIEKQDFVSIRINLVDLSPLTPQNAWCLANAKDINWIESPGCHPFTYYVFPAGQSANMTLENEKKVMSNKEPIEGPFGFELYGIGKGKPGVDLPGNETYFKRRENYNSLYECQTFDNHGVRDGICKPMSDPLPSGNGIFFFFSVRQLEEISRAEERIRQLTESFTQTREPRK